jgi:hypothetical protein
MEVRRKAARCKAGLFLKELHKYASVSGVAIAGPWPARAWAEWPCVTIAFATGRTGSTKKPPGLQKRPSGRASIHSRGWTPGMDSFRLPIGR